MPSACTEHLFKTQKLWENQNEVRAAAGCERRPSNHQLEDGNPEDLRIGWFPLQLTSSVPKTSFAKTILTLFRAHVSVHTDILSRTHPLSHPLLGKQVTICKSLEATKICFGGGCEQTRNSFASGHRWLSSSAYNRH